METISTDITSLSTPTFFQLQEEERYRLAQALADGPGQILANTLVELDHALMLLECNPRAAREGLAALREEVRAGLGELKGYIAELQPPLLEEMGLGPCLEQYVTHFGARNGIAVECEGCAVLRDRLPSTIETAIFRIVQEALANVLVHSGATHVQVKVERLAAQLQVQVEDNGRGFVGNAGGPRRRQLGLVAMQDRAQLIDGHLQIFSEAGKGLRVMVTVPYHSQQVAAGGQNENGSENQNGQNGGPHKKGGGPGPGETGK